jgi:hypothetical protein
MKIILGDLKESLVVSENTEIKATVKGNIIVETNCHLLLSGRVLGHVLVKPHARLELTGHVEGQVIYE